MAQRAAPSSSSAASAAAAQRRPKVAIVFSENTGGSLESKHIAFFIAAQLTSRGYCEVVFIPHRADGSPATIANERITYRNPGDSKTREVAGAEFSFNHWVAAEECDLMIVTANSEDTESIAKKLCEVYVTKKEDKKPKIPVFSLQRGVKNSASLNQEVGKLASELHRIVIVEGGVNFTVVPENGALSTSTRLPRLLIYRLDKDMEKSCEGPLNLLESCQVFDFFYDKTLTQYCWGVLLWDNLSALNAVTGGTLKSTLSSSANRKLLQIMMRESRLALVGGAGGHGWKPIFSLVFSKVSLMTPWLWEMMLHLPGPLFSLASFILVSNVDFNKTSHYRWDLENGRSTTIAKHLGEIVETGRKYCVEVGILETILSQIISYETAVKEGRSADINRGADDLARISNTLSDNKSRRRGDQEFVYYFSRVMMFLLAVPLFYFVLFL